MTNPAKAGEAASAKLTKTQELAVQFEGAEASAALIKAANWLATLTKTRSFTLEQRFVSVDLVDTSTRAHQQQIIDDYLALSHARREQEKVLWEAAHGYWEALSTAYADCIAATERDVEGATGLQNRIPVLAARGIRAAGMQIKWLAFRYSLVEPRVWANLARCVRFAEAHGVADSAVPLYRSQAERVSANQAFLRVLVLAASDNEGLSPLEQDMADRWIKYFIERFKLDRRAGDDVYWYFDLDHALPPRRIVGEPGAAAHRLFFGAADALAEIRRVQQKARQAGVHAQSVVPRAVLPKGSDAKQVIKVLDHLALHWDKPMPARAFERKLTTTCLEIRHDFRAAREVLVQSERARETALRSSGRIETWIVDNAGRGGYSAIVPKGQRPWLQLGVLIAIRVEYQKFWSLALIRRVETDEHHQRKVGIRVIARKPVAALLRSRAGSRMREEPGILLNTTPSSNAGVHVLMRPSAFTLEDEIDAWFGAGHTQSFTLKPTQVMEATYDYEWVRYEVKQ